MHQQTLIDQRCLDHMRQSKHGYQRSSSDMRQSETLVSEIIWYDKKQLQCSLTYNTQYPELIRSSLKMRTIILPLTKPEISEPHTPNSSATFWKFSHYITSMFILRLERGKSSILWCFILRLERRKPHNTSIFNTNTWKTKVSLYSKV
jgi:hypothetical protein